MLGVWSGDWAGRKSWGGAGQGAKKSCVRGRAEIYMYITYAKTLGGAGPGAKYIYGICENPGGGWGRAQGIYYIHHAKHAIN